MPEIPKTFQTAINWIGGQSRFTFPVRAAYLYDLVYQVADAYIGGKGLADEELSRKSIGKKLAYLENDPNEELKKALRTFRKQRLRCERRDSITEDLFESLQVAASHVLEFAGVGEGKFESRVPLGVETVNSVSIETVEGYRSFDILHADVLEVPADLVIISTHANPEEPPSGQLVHALKKKGVEIDPNLIFQVVDKDTMWVCFQEIVCSETCVGSVLTARMKTSRELDNPQAYFDDAVKGIFSSIAALEYLGHRFRVINLPVIYGQRIVDYEAAIGSLLKNALRWLKKSDHAEKVNFVVYSSEDLAVWDSALNQAMGRSLVAAGSDEVLKGMVKELAHQLSVTQESAFSSAIVPLQQALSKPDSICIENICVFGRKLCELLSLHLVERHNLKLSPILLNNIETLRESKIVAPWICSYMHSLRIFGNETVHTRSSVKYVPKSLDQNDLIASLSAIKSLLAFWNGQIVDTENTREEGEQGAALDGDSAALHPRQ